MTDPQVLEKKKKIGVQFIRIFLFFLLNPFFSNNTLHGLNLIFLEQ